MSPKWFRRYNQLGPGELIVFSGGLLADGRLAPFSHCLFIPEPHAHRALRRGAARARKHS